MSQSSKRKISRYFRVGFELKPTREFSKKGRKCFDDELFELFVKHFGKIEVASLYKVTVEVAQ